MAQPPTERGHTSPVEIPGSLSPTSIEHGRRLPRELALSAAWHGSLVRSLQTTDGDAIEVVFRGVWTHGFGPDFQDALLAFGERGLRTGAVEIHHRTADWRAHGHHLDPNYNVVILHLVRYHDGAETRRADGAIVPTAVLPVALETLNALDRRLPGIWDRLGGAVCAESLTRGDPYRVRGALHRLGDRRLAERTARFESELMAAPPATVLLCRLFDALGYAENREPMTAVAEAFPLPTLSQLLARATPDQRFATTLALLLGIGGFLPLAPADAAVGRLLPETVALVEQRWSEVGGPWAGQTLSPTAWQRARVRPANHPVLRLVQGASLLAAARGGLLSTLLEPLRTGGDPIQRLIELTRHGESPALGQDRAISIVASVLIPFAVAYAEHAEDSTLTDRAAMAWETLPAAALSRPAKRARYQVAGDAPLTRLGERGHQGLLALDRTLCTPRRCYECPIAHEVVQDGLKGEG